MTMIHYALVLLGCSVLTYLTRMPALLLSGKIRIPEKAKRFMSYLGPSVIATLIAPSIFILQDGPDFNPLTNIYIGSAAVTVIISLLFKKPIVSILSGVFAAFLLSLLLG